LNPKIISKLDAINAKHAPLEGDEANNVEFEARQFSVESSYEVNASISFFYDIIEESIFLLRKYM